MWQHEIYSELTKQKDAINFCIELEKATVFFMGDMAQGDNYRNIEKSLLKSNDGWFFSGITSSLRLPYPSCLFEYYDRIEENDDKFYGNRCAMLCSEYKQDHVIIQSATYTKIINKWTLYPLLIELKIGGSLNQGPGNSRIFYRNNEMGKLFYNNKIYTEEKLLSLDIPFLAVFLSIINCKNVQKTIQHVEVLKNKRKHGIIKKVKKLYSYYILTIKNHAKYNAANSSDDILTHNRIHFCRGHFKNYTPEKPLLGKYTGLYWWEPHIRGKDTSGFVDKDYEVIL